MIKIICNNCKNAYLEKGANGFSCPSCKAKYALSSENTLLGIQHYNDGNYAEADSCLMKALVADGADYKALFYKGLCDGSALDEDAKSLSPAYSKIIDAFRDIPYDEYARFLTLADGECAKLEKSLALIHISAFEEADAEKIKTEVSAIINFQNEAKDFRKALTELAALHNKNCKRQLSVKFSKCFLVSPSDAEIAGEAKYAKIKESIENHTVFTGILTNDIKNLEIFYRCIVMFFEKSRNKYDYLMKYSEVFTELEALLETGNYASLAGVSATTGKLKKVAYEFFEDSLKEYDEINPQTETVVVIEPQVEEVVADEAVVDLSESLENAETTEVEEVAEAEETTEIEEAPEAEAITEAETEIKAEAEVEAEQEIEAEAEAEAATDVEVEPDVEIEVESETETEVEVESEPEVEATAEPETETADATNEAAIEAEKEPITTRQPKKKKKGGKVVFAVIVIAIIAVLGVKFGPNVINAIKYQNAENLAVAEKYTEASKAFSILGEYRDSAAKAIEYRYLGAVALEQAGKFSEAKAEFTAIDGYKDSAVAVKRCDYEEAEALLNDGKFDEASKLFSETDYGDSANMVTECSYRKGVALIEEKKYDEAIKALVSLGDYSDAADKANEAKYLYATEHLEATDENTVNYLTELSALGYRNSADLREQLGAVAASANTSDGVKVFVNYDVDDTETALTELDHTRAVFFHAIITDKKYFDKSLSLDYVTAYGYRESHYASVSEGDTHVSLRYPATGYSGYTVTFELCDEDGSAIASQEISF